MLIFFNCIHLFIFHYLTLFFIRKFNYKKHSLGKEVHFYLQPQTKERHRWVQFRQNSSINRGSRPTKPTPQYKTQKRHSCIAFDFSLRQGLETLLFDTVCKKEKKRCKCVSFTV